MARVRRPSASGIDRVELEYLLYFLGSTHRRAFVAWDGPDLVRIPSWLASLLAVHLARGWFGAAEARVRLSEARIHEPRFPGVTAGFDWVIRRKSLLARGVRMASSSLRHQHGSRIYLNVSHRGLERFGQLGAVLGRSTVTVALVHDIMPILYPDYFPDGLCKSFESGLRATCASADLVVANSRATADEVLQWTDSAGVRTPRVAVSRLGVRLPTQSWVRTPAHVGSPYFVFLGTVSARKNVSVLFRAWNQLESGMKDAPRLLVIGADAASTRSEVARLAPLAAHRIEVREGLDDAAVFSLLGGARGLLMPSRAEGFGLPVAEALALGVPVACSDILAFREFEGAIRFLDPDDPCAWATAIQELAGSSVLNVPRVSRSWAEHIEETVHLSLALTTEGRVQ